MLPTEPQPPVTAEPNAQSATEVPAEAISAPADEAAPAAAGLHRAVPPPPGEVALSEPKLFVGNFPYEATEEDIKEHFHGFDVIEVHIRTNPVTGKSKGFSFVTFPSIEIAQEALVARKGSEMMGRELRVAPTTQRAKAMPKKRKKRDVYDHRNAPKQGTASPSSFFWPDTHCASTWQWDTNERTAWRKARPHSPMDDAAAFAEGYHGHGCEYVLHTTGGIEFLAAEQLLAFPGCTDIQLLGAKVCFTSTADVHTLRQLKSATMLTLLCWVGDNFNSYFITSLKVFF